jgi:hypothetical protein
VPCASLGRPQANNDAAHNALLLCQLYSAFALIEMENLEEPLRVVERAVDRDTLRCVGGCH